MTLRVTTKNENSRSGRLNVVSITCGYFRQCPKTVLMTQAEKVQPVLPRAELRQGLDTWRKIFRPT
jgi:hypothetical protein